MVEYFGHTRKEIRPLLPDRAERILEIGCSSGQTLAWLKTIYPDARTVGVDGHQPIKDQIAANADEAVIHDLEQPLPELGTFDLILALDILEHLREPAVVLRGLAQRLTPGGRLIVSVPNISHHSILSGLLKRRFEYQEAGILDRTHLRFFTESSAIALLNEAGLSVKAGVVNGLSRKKSRLLNALSFGMLKHYLVEQYIMAGEIGTDQAEVRWAA